MSNNKDIKDTDQHPNMNFEDNIYSKNRLDMNMVVMYGGIPTPEPDFIDFNNPSVTDLGEIMTEQLNKSAFQDVLDALNNAEKNKDNKVLFKYWMIMSFNLLNNHLKENNVSQDDFKSIEKLLK